MSPYDLLLAPFVEFDFMQRALVGTLALSIGACPVGVFLMLRRMSLSGDAIAHALLPGAAIGFLVAGLSLVPMMIGGLVAGLTVALGAGAVSRLTVQREDASMAAFYLIALALGVVLVSLRGSSVDLMHVLFGNVLALDDAALILIGVVTTASLLGLAVIWRPLVADCLDPAFLRSVSRAGGMIHTAFLVLVVFNLVGGFQALGTLLSVGLMMLPAVTARFWSRELEGMCLAAIGFGIVASVIGLLVSFHAGVPSGPAIVLVAGVFYVSSLLVAPRGLLAPQLAPRRHRVG
jgi:zinc/manganese transport system permease protein